MSDTNEPKYERDKIYTINVSEIASFACCLERPKYRLVKAILRLIRRNLLKLGSEEK